MEVECKLKYWYDTGCLECGMCGDGCPYFQMFLTSKKKEIKEAEDSCDGEKLVQLFAERDF